MLEFFGDGGPFMWPLGLWSIMGLAFFIERVFTYARMRSEDELSEVTNDLTSRIDSGASFEQLQEYCTEVGKLEGEVYSEGIERFQHLSREERSIQEMRVEMNGTVGPPPVISNVIWPSFSSSPVPSSFWACSGR